ncbi:hypothetical protein Vafri_1811 [Volvox africanus]|nr:hypothetical protein Vafri_1811 [Volvox africanus]
MAPLPLRFQMIDGFIRRPLASCSNFPGRGGGGRNPSRSAARHSVHLLIDSTERAWWLNASKTAVGGSPLRLSYVAFMPASWFNTSGEMLLPPVAATSTSPRLPPAGRASALTKKLSTATVMRLVRECFKCVSKRHRSRSPAVPPCHGDRKASPSCFRARETHIT